MIRPTGVTVAVRQASMSGEAGGTSGVEVSAFITKVLTFAYSYRSPRRFLGCFYLARKRCNGYGNRFFQLSHHSRIIDHGAISVIDNGQINTNGETLRERQGSTLLLYFKHQEQLT